MEFVSVCIETSVWGRDSNSFFMHLVTNLYLCTDYDQIFLCGDYNARIGDIRDNIPEIDNICERGMLDNVKVGHYDGFIDFLKDSRLCILNGRMGESPWRKVIIRA